MHANTANAYMLNGGKKITFLDQIDVLGGSSSTGLSKRGVLAMGRKS